MTAAEFVWKIIQELVAKSSWKSVAERAGVTENTLRGTERGKTKFQTLVIIVKNLLGEEARAKFILDFGIGEGAETDVQIARNSAKNAESVPMPLEQKFAEPYMLLASEDGATPEELASWLPHKKLEVDDLVDKKVIQLRSGRYVISDWSNSGNRAIAKLRMKLVAFDSSDSRFRRGQAFSNVHRVSLEGYQSYVELCQRFQKECEQLEKRFGCPDGIPIVSGCIMATSIADKCMADAIDNFNATEK